MVSNKLIWFIVSLLFLLIEMGHPGLFFFLSFSCGALAAAICSYFYPSLIVQGLVFLAVAIISFKALRLWVSHRLSTIKSHTKTNSEALIGKRAVVIESISSTEPGRVKLSGDIWLAKSIDHKNIAVGKQVEIIKIIGSHVVVKDCHDHPERNLS
jgi:membrane protein implicated in regulation of membrane protease activity